MGGGGGVGGGRGVSSTSRFSGSGMLSLAPPRRTVLGMV